MKICINMPTQVKEALNILTINKYEAYIVGGCVRDSLLGKKPSDWDITTSAPAEDIINCFSEFKVIKTGLKHGTVTVIINNMPLEITTYRIDGLYTDNRRPDSVEFTQNLREDLQRRDFTVNALAYNDIDGIVDLYGGIKDMENKKIKCVGNPDERFNEDGLRILRAIRFAAILDFNIEQRTAMSIHENKILLNNISAERISSELNKLILGVNAKYILNEYRDVLSVFMPEIIDMFEFEQHNVHHCYDVWRHTVEAVNNIDKDVTLKLTMFFHDIGKPFCFTVDEKQVGHFYGHAKKSAEIAETILKRLKYDNETIENVKTLISYHRHDLKPEPKQIKRLLNTIGEKLFKMLLKVKKSDTMSGSSEFWADKLENLELIDKLSNEIINENQCFNLKSLAVNGRDLIELGIPKGKEIGDTLSKLMDMVIDEKIQNNKEILLAEANKEVYKGTSK